MAKPNLTAQSDKSKNWDWLDARRAGKWDRHAAAVEGEPCDTRPWRQRASPSFQLTRQLLLGLSVLSVASVAGAQAVLEGVAAEVLLSDLKQPSGVTVRPGGSRSGPDVLVSETGAGRIVGLSTTNDELGLVEVVTGFIQGGSSAPGAILFRSRNRLLVCQAASGDTPTTLSEYDIDDDNLPMDAGQRKVKLECRGENAPATIEGLARQDDELFATTGSQELLLHTRWRGPQASDFRTFTKPVESAAVGRPMAVAFSDKGYLVIGLAGDNSTAKDSLIVFLHPENWSAAPLLVLETGLEEIVALAYNPASGNLYAANAAANGTSGVYRLDAGSRAASAKQSCEAVLVARFDRPRAIAFGEDGAAYVVDAGDGTNGRLVKLTGSL